MQLLGTHFVGVLTTRSRASTDTLDIVKVTAHVAPSAARESE